jgi:hypothetical protein
MNNAAGTAGGDGAAGSVGASGEFDTIEAVGTRPLNLKKIRTI